MIKFCVRIVQRWLPEPFIFAILLTFVAAVVAMPVCGQTPMEVLEHWGGGVWNLLAFAMQMALVLVCGSTLLRLSPKLPPEEIPPCVEKTKGKPFFTAGKKRGILLAICFVAALLGGFMLAGYSQDQSEAKQNQQQMERQQGRDGKSILN